MTMSFRSTPCTDDAGLPVRDQPGNASIPDWPSRMPRMKNWLLHDRVQRFRCSRRDDDARSQKKSRAVSSGSNFCQILPPGFQGYITATCGFQGWVRLCLHHQRLSQESPTWRRAISRCARIATRKTYRAAVPACEERALRTRLINHRGVRFQIGLPYSFFCLELSHCRPWPATC